MKTILLVTMRDLTDPKPYADTLRFLKLQELLPGLGYKVITVSRNKGLGFRADPHQDSYLLPAPASTYGAALWLLLFSPFYLRRIVAKERPSLVFINSFLFSRFLPANVKVQADIMGLEYREKPLGRQLFGQVLSRFLQSLERRLVSQATFVTTVNNAHAAVLKQLTDRPIFVWRDGVEAATISSTSNPTTPNEVIFAGSIANKRLDDLFAALEQLKHRRLSLPVTIIGDGPDRAYYQERARAQGLKQVQFLGYMKHAELQRRLGEAAYGYSDDWSEIGFPVKVFEYMAAGAVTICQDTPAVREVIKPNQNGLLYQNQQKLAELLSDIASGKIDRAGLAKQAQQDIRAHFWQQRAKELAAIYRQSSI